MTSDSEINWAENEQEARDTIPANGGYTDERAPGLTGDPATTDVKDNQLSENYRAYDSATPSETPTSQKTDLNRLDELDVDSAPTPPSVVDGQLSADDFQPASEPGDQSDFRMIGPVSGPYEKPSAATWRGQHFTGTLGMRMAQAKKVTNVLSLADIQSSFGPVVDEQITRLQRLALAAAGPTRAENVDVPATQTLNLKSFATHLHGWQAKIRKPSSTEPNVPFRAAGLMMVLAAMFVGGILTQSIGSRTSEVAHKIDEQNRLTDEMFGKLKLQEEKLLTLEVETRGSAEEFRRSIAEERAWLKAEIETRSVAQKLLLDVAAEKLQVREENLLTQEDATRGTAVEFKRLIADERAWLKAEIERKIDEKLEGLDEADEKKWPSDGLAAKRQAIGQKRASEIKNRTRPIGYLTRL